MVQAATGVPLDLAFPVTSGLLEPDVPEDVNVDNDAVDVFRAPSNSAGSNSSAPIVFSDEVELLLDARERCFLGVVPVD